MNRKGKQTWVRFALWPTFQILYILCGLKHGQNQKDGELQVF